MKTHPTNFSNKMTPMASSYENQPRALPCAFAASEVLIAWAQCSIEDREWSGPGRFLSWYVESKKMIRSNIIY